MGHSPENVIYCGSLAPSGRCRRTECGSHFDIFMLRGDPAWGMKGFCGNVGSGSHADRAVCGKRGFVEPTKDPRLAATAVANVLTVATIAALFLSIPKRIPL